MLSAFLIALREGVEASLVVGIILVYLSRTGRAHLARFAWYGVAAAVALSLGIAIALERFQISEDGFEGVMLLVAAAFVITMIVWMNRVARHLKKEIESKVEAYAAKAGDAAGWGIFLFVFLMVVREGAELALILRAVELSTAGLQTWIGTLTGIAAAVAVGVFFFKGTLRIPLARFFAATSVILMLVVFQLAITGLHELSEAQWLPSSRTEMAIVGPIVRNDLFFFVFIFGAAALLVMREWQNARLASAVTKATNDAEKRLLESQNRRQRRWMVAAASACLIVILALTADFIYARANSAAPTITKIDGAGKRFARADRSVNDGDMHLVFRRCRRRQNRPFHDHQEADRLGHRARRLPHLRSRRLPAGRPKRDLPPLRLGDLRPYDRRSRRLQPDRRPVARRWRRPRPRYFRFVPGHARDSELS